MKSGVSNDENTCVVVRHKRSIKKRIVVDLSKGKNICRLNSKILSDNIYIKKPISNRKLIERYSTARYNLNTKLIYTKQN